MKLVKLDDIMDAVDENTTLYDSTVSHISGKESKLDPAPAWTWPLITGRVYAGWWADGIDFKSVTVWGSKYAQNTDENIVLKFNNTEFR